MGRHGGHPERPFEYRGSARAYAMVWLATPFSVKSCSSSPVSAISRTMSQPPTNSPLT
jgi:hypothetical protein